MTTKRKRILWRCSLQASFMFEASKSILRRNTKRVYTFHNSYIDTPCSSDKCPCCPQQAVCASGPTQCPWRGPAFVIALFGDARPIYCATCIPRPDNDEYRYERTAFQNWNKFPFAVRKSRACQKVHCFQNFFRVLIIFLR
jgi:hypothetical protein